MAQTDRRGRIATLLDRPATRFLIVGGLNTALSYAVFRCVLGVLHGRRGAPAVAQAAAYLVGVAVGYAAHRRLTFRSAGSVRSQVFRFAAVNAAMLAATAVAMQLLVGSARLPAPIAWLGVTTVATVASFQLQRRVVFAADRHTRHP